MTLETVSQWRSHGGVQTVYRHLSSSTGTPMQFSAFVPDHLAGSKMPVVWYLSGLTCTAMNVTEKGDFRRACSDLGIIFIAPDTSPRGEDVADDAGYDLGQGAGFYVDATEAPWSSHYRMKAYIEDELPAVVADAVPVDLHRQSITGHSMGAWRPYDCPAQPGPIPVGLGLRPDRVADVLSLGEKALGAYLGSDRAAWRDYDACALIDDGARLPEVLVDQGAPTISWGSFSQSALPLPASARGIPLQLRMQPGYDHSYYFISTFMADHLNWHARHLGEH